MLCKAKTLKGYKLDSLNGEIGKVKDFCFDDHYWTIRYLVANTGNWLPGRKVLISPYALGDIEKDKQQIAVNLSKEQIVQSPSLENHQPVSRQFEDNFYGYYGWPNYWDGYSQGHDSLILGAHEEWREATHEEKAWDPNLRSMHEVTGYHIQAADGELGHVEDFVIDDDSWAIRYLVIDTQNWWPGNKVLISPEWIERVSWTESKVFINLARSIIQEAPEFTEKSLLNRDYETELHRYYNRPGYWVDKLMMKMQGI